MDKANDRRVYAIAPSGVATGGTEAIHVLCRDLRSLGIDAKIWYVDCDGGEPIVPKRFERFCVPYVTAVSDDCDVVLVVPEVRTHVLRKFHKATKVIWWLSIDNYVKRVMFRWCGPRTLLEVAKNLVNGSRVDFGDKSIVHLCQSHYALDFVTSNGACKTAFLMDYLGEEHLGETPQNAEREDVVLYNPSKGIDFTRALIGHAGNSLRFVPLSNMSPTEVHGRCLASKVYIDFGNHPGKDRFPREAAMAGCVVVTNRKGSAAYDEDVPIPPAYKFNGIQEEIGDICDLISDCMVNYEKRICDFDRYREFIRNDKERFLSDLKRVFLSGDFL